MIRNDILIGEFSHMTGISKRMIRHFDMLGLLNPHHSDEVTGYRYYHAKQIRQAKEIVFLQELGFSLKEIGTLLEHMPDAEKLLDVLKDQEVKLRVETDQKVGQLLKLKKLIDYIVSHPRESEEIWLAEAERKLPMDKYQVLKEEVRRLPGSDLLMERIEESIDVKDTPIYFVTFDIDNFLHVNDDYGYDVGDRVIYRFYEIVKEAFNELLKGNSRNMLARLGGDEFAFFLLGVIQSEVIASAEKVIRTMEQHNFAEEGCKDSLTSSCGIAQTEEMLHPRELWHRSSKALIEAKRRGKNRYLLDQEI